MKPMNIAVRLMAIATLSVGAASMAFANNQISNLEANAGGGTLFSFTGGVGGTLNTTGSGISVDASGPAAGDTNPLAVFALTDTFGPPLTSGITETGAAVANPFPLSGYTTQFSGGSFQITDGGTDLLSGTFASSYIFNTTTSSGNLNNLSLNDVSFDPGSAYVTDYIAEYGGTVPVVGDMNLSISAVQSGYPTSTHPNTGLTATGSGGGLGAFSANGFGGTFDATSSVVPESSGSILMLAALAPLAIGGLLFRRKRTTGSLLA